MKNRILIILSIIVIGLILIFIFVKPKIETWKITLPNNYILEKVTEEKFILEKKDNNKTKIEDYIAEYAYGKKYISIKCAKNENNNILVYFYIIDSENNDIYGPYNDEETYNKVKEKIIDEEISEWIKTSNK